MCVREDPTADGEWPFAGKGSFQAIVLRAHSNPGKFLAGVLKVLKLASVLPGDSTVADVVRLYCTAESWPLPQNEIFVTSILLWSWEDEALWDGYVSSADALPYARSIAMGKFKEDIVIT